LRTVASTFHIDTLVIIPMLVRGRTRNEIVREARRFRRRLTQVNIHVKVSLVALGELLVKSLEEYNGRLVGELIALKNELGDRLELGFFPPREFNVYSIADRLLNADDRLMPADALIIASAIADQEADILYMNDKIILSASLKEMINSIRSEYGFKKFKLEAFESFLERRTYG